MNKTRYLLWATILAIGALSLTACHAEAAPQPPAAAPTVPGAIPGTLLANADDGPLEGWSAGMAPTTAPAAVTAPTEDMGMVSFVLLGLGACLKRSPLPDWIIPVALAGLGGAALCLLKGWTPRTFFLGIYAAAMAIAGHQFVRQATKDAPARPPLPAGAGALTAVLAFGLLLGAPLAQGQTNTPAIPTPAGIQIPNIVSVLASNLLDTVPYWGTNKTILLDSGIVNSGHTYGGFLDLQVPLGNQESVGLLTAFYNKTFYAASLDTKLGTTATIPLLSQFIGPVYLYTEAGPAFNLANTKTVLGQVSYGVEWFHQFSSAFGVQLGYGEGTMTSLGHFRNFNCGLSWHW